MKKNTADILAFGPHPLDTEMGIGGSVVHWIGEGKKVVYVICTNGDKGSSDPDMKPDKLAAIREEEQLVNGF